MNWAPAGIPDWAVRLAGAIEKRFAPRFPDRPVRLPGYAQDELTAALAQREPYGLAINTTTGKVVRSALNGGGTAFEWMNADGSAL